MSWARLLIWVVGALLGVAAEGVAFGWSDPAHWVPDLAVGWTLIGCGLVAVARRPGNLSGPLMVTAGFTWFLGNFVGAGNELVAWAAANGTFVHRGPLIHLLLSYPDGALTTRLERGAVVAGYIAAFLEPVWHSDVATIVLAGLLLAIGAARYLRSVGRMRRARALAVSAAAAFSMVLVGGAIARVIAGSAAARPALIAYQIVLMAMAGGLLAGLLIAPWERVDIVDLVVELGEARTGSLRAELSRALGDPTLEVGYWMSDTDDFVDADGRALVLPQDDPGRSVTIVRREEGEPVAAIVHHPAVLDDPQLLEAVSSAARLGASNARLQAELQRRVTEVAESRLRILEAGDDERSRLERRLEQGAERRLISVDEALRRAVSSAASQTTRDQIVRARAQLQQTLDDVNRLALGLHPRVLHERGLAEALAALASSLPVEVRLDVGEDRVDPRVEAVAYFVCSEALTNVVKHAGATHARVSVRRDAEKLDVTIEDDGFGGADPAEGTGLRGLADRVETVGGTVQVRSAPGQGTTLTAEIPLGDQGRPVSL